MRDGGWWFGDFSVSGGGDAGGCSGRGGGNSAGIEVHDARTAHSTHSVYRHQVVVTVDRKEVLASDEKEEEDPDGPHVHVSGRDLERVRQAFGHRLAVGVHLECLDSEELPIVRAL